MTQEIAMYDNAVVGVSGLPADADAVALATALSPRPTRLALVHVCVIDAVPSRGFNSAHEVSQRTLSDQLLPRARNALAPDADLVSLSEASVGAGLHNAAEARDARLIVVGSCHRSAVGRILAGDSVQSVLHHAPCAVAIAPAGYASRRAHAQTIAVAYDGSDESKVALAHAALLASDLGAEVLARDVVELHVYGAGPWSAGTILEDPDSLATATRERLGNLGDIHPEVVIGPVRSELADLSEMADVLVCGSRHQGAIGRVALGSTSDYLARHARCPLIVTPAVDQATVAAWQAVGDPAAA